MGGRVTFAAASRPKPFSGLHFTVLRGVLESRVRRGSRGFGSSAPLLSFRTMNAGFTSRKRAWSSSVHWTLPNVLRRRSPILSLL